MERECDALTPVDVLETVDLANLTLGMGWHNKVSVMSFVRATHDTMRKLFATASWDQAAQVTLPQQFNTTRADPSVLMINDTSLPGLSRSGLQQFVADGYRRFESCVDSELLLATFHAKLFALRLVESAVLDQQLYGARNVLLPELPVFEHVKHEMFSDPVLITTSAGSRYINDTPKYFAGLELTRETTSKAVFKRDRPMAGGPSMGSPSNQLLAWAKGVSSGRNVTVVNDSVVIEWWHLAQDIDPAFYDGDHVHSSMRVFPLRERQERTTNWFEAEKTISRWYRSHEVNDNNSLIKLANATWGDDSPYLFEDDYHPYCLEALFRKLSQIVWILMLKQQPALSRVVFMANIDAPSEWFKRQMTVKQVLGESMAGTPVSFPISRDGAFPSNVTGVSWVLLPMLTSLGEMWNETTLLAQIMAQMNDTFFDLAAVEYGKLMFQDATHCYFGEATLGVNATDDKHAVRTKLYARMELMVQRVIEQSSVVHAQLNHAVGRVQFPIELWSTNVTSDPAVWHRSALGAGLLRLASAVHPTDEDMLAMIQSLVCYDVMETTSLNVSTRCWVEPNSVVQTRERRTSDGLRSMRLTMWAMGVVLNLLGVVVAGRYSRRVLRMFWKHGRSDLTIALSLCLDIQGVRMVSVTDSLLLSLSCVPLILSYHLPSDPTFELPRLLSSTGQLVFEECMVLLSLTWFVQLGVQCGSSIIKLRHGSAWSRLLSGRIRLLLVLLLAALRACLRVNDYNSGLWKLIVSCVGGVVLGIIAALPAVLLDKRPPAFIDNLSEAKLSCQLSRNAYGVLGQWTNKWSHMGMLAEGWQAITIRGQPQALINGRVRLLSLSVGDQQPDVVDVTPAILTSFLTSTLRPNLSSSGAPEAPNQIGNIKRELSRLMTAAYPRGRSSKIIPLSPSTQAPAQQTRGIRVVVVAAILLIQVLWVLSIPVRNILVMAQPSVNNDGVQTATNAYGHAHATLPHVVPGHQMYEIVRSVVNVSLSKPSLRLFFEQKGDFVIDKISDLLSPENLRLTLVDLEMTTRGMGWQNKVSLMGFVTNIHTAMRKLFATHKWSDGYNQIYPWRSEHTRDPGRLYHNSWAIAGTYIDSWEQYLFAGFQRVESCFGSEFIMSYYYSSVFACRIIQSTLMNLGLYDASDLVQIPYDFENVRQQMFAHDVYITSAAGSRLFAETVESVQSAVLTSNVSSFAAWKHDRPMEGPTLMGNSMRMLQYMHWYPNSYYSYLNVSVANDTVVADWRQLGALYAGFNGFKFDLLHNLMGVYRMAERNGNADAMHWFDEEQEVARWSKAHEDNDTNSLVKLAETIWADDSPTKYEGTKPQQRGCMQALLRKLAQVAWIMALKQKPSLSHLVFMSMDGADQPSAWFQARMGSNALWGEAITGLRVSFTFAPDRNDTVVTTSSWVLVPLLKALHDAWGTPQLLLTLTQEVNTTLPSLVDVDAGRLMLHDASNCAFGFGTLGVNANDDKAAVWRKIQPRMEQLVATVVDRVDVVYSQLLKQTSGVVSVPHEYVVDNRTSDSISYPGPPVYWQHTALGVGLLRLASQVHPTDADVQKLRSSMVCYDTLEMRFLNLSVRCWAEPNSVMETRWRYESLGLRLVEFATWGVCVVLNAIGMMICLRYVWALLRVLLLHGLSDLTLATACDLGLQEIGVLSLDATAVMALTVLPTLVMHHMPGHATNAMVAEVMALLGLTWPFQVGLQLGRQCLRLQHHSRWLSVYAGRMRWVVALVVLVPLRRCFHITSYHSGLVKLVVSCSVSLVLGLASALVALLVDIPSASVAVTDELSAAMRRHGFYRNRYGLLCQRTPQWSHAGLVLEGWKALLVGGEVAALIHGRDVVLVPHAARTHELRVVEVGREIFRNALGCVKKTGKQEAFEGSSGPFLSPVPPSQQPTLAK
ncbi:TPA: hypothetical protein N0F65_012223 [Lagenidium giganteum]|uniref:Uncharacterized protein n=1 Tax=Lagenidium giganteum TaxID=4803 RepID=A0AAV2ZN47_9STRA|nr:TPA: hypothetical protein N0F65_012223 [Lagenidium giganteum]